MNKEGLSYIDSMKYLAKKAGIKLDDNKSSQEFLAKPSIKVFTIFDLNPLFFK